MRSSRSSRATPRVLHAGEANVVVLPLLGHHSVLVLDEAAHMSQRKLMLPSFHGERMRGYEQTMAEVAAEEIESWPAGQPYAVRPAMQRITLEVIIRTVFGVQDDERRAPPARGPRERARVGDEPPPHGDARGARPAATRALQPVRGGASAGRRADLRGDPRAPPRNRPRGARRRALAAAAGPPRGRQPDGRRGAARRADDAAGGRTRDDGVVARLGRRALGAHAGRARAPRATATTTTSTPSARRRCACARSWRWCCVA